MEHDVRHRDVDERLAVFRVSLVIFGEPSVEAKPAEGSLNNPSPRKDVERTDFGAFDDLDRHSQFCFDEHNEFSCVSLISEDCFDSFELHTYFCKYGLCTNTIGE